MPPEPYTIREARPEELPELLDVLVEAFTPDPFMRVLLGEEPQPEKIRGLFELQLKSLYIPSGFIDVAVDSDGAILGTAQWMPPEGQQGTLKLELRDGPKYLKILGARALRHVIATDIYIRKHRPAFDHWYLHTIGVRATAQGRGVGSALLEHGITRFNGTAAYLEASTPRSATLYTRHGFVPVGTYKGTSPAAGMLYPATIDGVQYDPHLAAANGLLSAA